MSLKDNLIKKFAPFLFREFLRILYIKEHIVNTDEPMESLAFSKRVVLKKMLDAFRFPDKTIWTTLFVPPEILYAMGINSFCLEVGASLFSKIGQTQNALLEAEAHGVPTDGCSFHRAAIGYAYKNFYPKTRLIATTTSLCDSNPKTAGICQSITGKDFMVLDVPYDMNDDAVAYLAQQLEDFVSVLEKTFGKKMDIDILKKHIECGNRTREKMLEVNNLRMDINSPLTGSDALGLIVQNYLIYGTDECEEFYDLLIKDIKRGTAVNRAKRQDDNKTKILWLELKPYFSGDLLTNMENNLNVKIIFEEISHLFWDEMDPNKPYESLARKLISNNNNGPLENRLKVLKMLTNKYDVDGVIMFASWGCRRNGAAIPAIKDELRKDGIPSLILYGDCIDDSTYTDGQFSTRVEGFLEMLDTKSKNV